MKDPPIGVRRLVDITFEVNFLLLGILAEAVKILTEALERIFVFSACPSNMNGKATGRYYTDIALFPVAY